MFGAQGMGDSRPREEGETLTDKVWFITGTSRGFGRARAAAALERGDKVAATARNTESLAGLVEKYGDAVLPIQLDVTDWEADFAAGGFATDWAGPSSRHSAELPDYAEVHAQSEQRRASRIAKPGDP